MVVLFGVALKLLYKKRSFHVIKERRDTDPSQERTLRHKGNYMLMAFVYP
jgi:hypothetical protein